MVLACAHRRTTVLLWGFCEHEGPFDHSFLFSSPCSPTSLHEGGLVDPQLRASNDINDPSKLACSLSGMGAD